MGVVTTQLCEQGMHVDVLQWVATMARRGHACVQACAPQHPSTQHHHALLSG
jgi:hypothetical protein